MVLTLISVKIQANISTTIAILKVNLLIILDKEHARNQFNPYVNNGGTVVAVAGEDFVVVGGDSRLSEGYSIVTRNESKLVKMTDKTILATSGMFADFCELRKVLAAKLEIYDYKIERQPTT